MKAVGNLIVAVMVVVGLIGCAATPAKETTKVTCPACGYEIELPYGL